MALTAKQEAFCQAIADGLSQADAYRSAYNAEKMKPESVQRMAHELIKDLKITSRVQELQSELEIKQLWTREQSVKTIMRGLESAENNEKPMEMFKGVELLNKMFGYDAPQKLEISPKSGVTFNITTEKVKDSE